jgi:HEPN domain
MPSRQELKDIARTRLKEVKALYNVELYDGATYLSGYVIEAALKARICKILDKEYPEKLTSFKTHRFDELIVMAGLEKRLDEQKRINMAFATNWSLITGWKVESRYNPIGSNTQSDVDDLVRAIEDRVNGILTWIKRTW